MNIIFISFLLLHIFTTVANHCPLLIRIPVIGKTLFSSFFYPLIQNWFFAFLCLVALTTGIKVGKVKIIRIIIISRIYSRFIREVICHFPLRRPSYSRTRFNQESSQTAEFYLLIYQHQAKQSFSFLLLYPYTPGTTIWRIQAPQVLLHTAPYICEPSQQSRCTFFTSPSFSSI